MTFLVEQHVYLWVGYVLFVREEVTLHFLEMDEQHLQEGFLQGIELPSLGLVISMLIGIVDLGGSGNCFNLALTSFFAKLSPLVKLRHCFGTVFLSASVGAMICLIFLVSRSGEYFTFRNVSYVCLSFLSPVNSLVLLEKGTELRDLCNRSVGYPLSFKALRSLSETSL